MSQPETVICTFRVKPGEEAAFEALLARHWPTLRKLGLATETPTQLYRGQEEGGAYYVEIFEWTSKESSGLAHDQPEVMAIWEPMGGLCEARGDKPAMSFPHVQKAAIELAQV